MSSRPKSYSRQKTPRSVQSLLVAPGEKDPSISTSLSDADTVDSQSDDPQNAKSPAGSESGIKEGLVPSSKPVISPVVEVETETSPRSRTFLDLVANCTLEPSHISDLIQQARIEQDQEHERKCKAMIQEHEARMKQLDVDIRLKELEHQRKIKELEYETRVKELEHQRLIKELELQEDEDEEDGDGDEEEVNLIVSRHNKIYGPLS